MNIFRSIDVNCHRFSMFMPLMVMVEVTQLFDS